MEKADIRSQRVSFVYPIIAVLLTKGYIHLRLAEISHNLLEISLSPSVPASLRNIPTKYNIIVRLWTYGFHKLLESLRRASFTSPLALEHLQDFLLHSFYTGVTVLLLVSTTVPH